jgi:hypothetical protein
LRCRYQQLATTALIGFQMFLDDDEGWGSLFAMPVSEI